MGHEFENCCALGLDYRHKRRSLSTTETEARKLKTGDKVEWPDGSKGEVIDTGYAGIRIGWEDGQYSVVQFDNTGGLLNQLKRAS